MAKILYFKSFKTKGRTISFEYEYNREIYVNKIILNELPEGFVFNIKNDNNLNDLLCYVGIIFTIYMFNVDYFDEIVVECIGLDEEDVLFFSEIFYKGLAEFRLVNDIKINKKIKLSSSIGPKKRKQMSKLDLKNKSLLLNGGGKDCVVGAEILKEIGEKFSWLTLDMNRSRERIIVASGVSSSLSIDRIRDKKADEIAEKNAKYSGHKPFSAYMAFVSVLVAYVYKYKYVVVSNEYSANISNLIKDRVEINHQYTKSFEFEIKFNKFVRERLFEGIEYYSILRPLYEIQVVKIFSNYSKYFPDFLSCNKGKNTDEWCLECPKCAFVFLSLAAFISEKNINKIWGSNLFLNKNTVKNIIELVNENPKPLDCVGTKEECRLALFLCKQKGLLEKTKIIYKKELEKHIENYDHKKELKKYMFDHNKEKNFPKEFSEEINQFFSKMLNKKSV